MKKRHITLFIVLLIAAVLFLAAATVIYFKLPQEDKPLLPRRPQATVSESTAATVDSTIPVPSAAASVTTEPSQEPSVVPDATEAEQATEAPLAAPDSMTQILAEGGESLQSLTNVGCRQLVTVSSSGSSAEISYYSLQDDQWIRDDSMTCSGFVGSNGVTSDMHEGGRATPKGLYHIGEAFYINDQPETGLSSFQVTEDIYWVDDPSSKYYNRKVEGTDDKDWNSAEHMIDYSFQYQYGFVIEYNLSQEYNKGSAIFFHVSANPTAGCVGTSQSDVLQYLAKLDASQNPYIMIV